MGIKPLYYYSRAARFAFASEVKALEHAHICPLTLDRDAVDSFLAYGAVIGPNTIFQEIRELEPGHLLRVIATARLPIRILVAQPQPGRESCARPSGFRAVGLADTRTSRIRRRIPSGQRCSRGSVSFRRRGFQPAGPAGVAMREEPYHAADCGFRRAGILRAALRPADRSRIAPSSRGGDADRGTVARTCFPRRWARWTSRRWTGSIPTSSRAWARRWA